VTYYSPDYDRLIFTGDEISTAIAAETGKAVDIERLFMDGVVVHEAERMRDRGPRGTEIEIAKLLLFKVLKFIATVGR